MAVGLVMTVTAASAQTPQAAEDGWRIAASTGAYVPFSSLIVAADEHDTSLSAGPAFSLEGQYQINLSASIYVNGTVAFGSIRLGSSIQPSVLGPTDQVRLATGTAGIVLAAPDWFGANFQPTLRVGGGFKWYSFDLTGADSQLRPTADLGVGFRGTGLGPIEVMAEARYLPSTFDQAKLPTRGIAAQNQRQSDFFFSVGFGIRAM
jgi:hypothetical protein